MTVRGLLVWKGVSSWNSCRSHVSEMAWAGNCFARQNLKRSYNYVYIYQPIWIHLYICLLPTMLIFGVQPIPAIYWRHLQIMQILWQSLPFHCNALCTYRSHHPSFVSLFPLCLFAAKMDEFPESVCFGSRKLV